MKKLLSLLGVVLLSGVLTACSIKERVAGGLFAPRPKTFATEAARDLQSAVASGRPAKCVTMTDIAGVKSEAQMYIDTKGERLRMKTKVVVNPKMTQLSNSLKIKDKIYTWAEGAKEGAMMDLATAKDTKVEQKAAPTPAVPMPMKTISQEEIMKLSEQINTSCEVWELDEELFKLPTDVKFVDQMQKIKELTEKARRK